MDNKIFITMNIAKEDMVRNKFLNLNSWKSNGPLSKEALLKLVVGTNTLICTPTDDVGMDVLNAAGPSLQAICTISPTTDHIDVNECRKRNVAVEAQMCRRQRRIQKRYAPSALTVNVTSPSSAATACREPVLSLVALYNLDR
ncbi:GRHPR-like protein [Mya arenaria]|uniref:GRHPR-like protein n=1 Tax=Mya arenaria TaxID=6604 RepID=A0ABY7EYH6_MYAAR|nr:GRHPR-like protein [Mya arenaria]